MKPSFCCSVEDKYYKFYDKPFFAKLLNIFTCILEGFVFGCLAYSGKQDNCQFGSLSYGCANRFAVDHAKSTLVFIRTL